MKVLLTGNLGYIGSILTQKLLERSYTVIGYDTNWYKDSWLYNLDLKYQQIFKDTRDCTVEDLRDIDSIIHLAALSNDPLGELNPRLTLDINYEATMKLAKLAKQAGVKRFIYGSSQSMYGVSNTDNELDEDTSEKNPLTEYAKTKWDAELQLNNLADDNFIVTSFRPSTVFGASPKLRTDIVFNNLVACAYTTGRIEIKSDGTPWRPVIHVQDVANAFISGLEAPAELIQRQGFNVGIKNGNYTVRDLAEAAQRAVPGSKLTFTGEHGSDTRTYRVSFKKILNILKDYYKPQWDLNSGGKELVDLFKQINFTETDFRGRKTVRLECIKYLLDKKELDNNLKWINNN
jgi:nucleoside-diphosphate-sugar epimerase